VFVEEPVRRAPQTEQKLALSTFSEPQFGQAATGGV